MLPPSPQSRFSAGTSTLVTVSSLSGSLVEITPSTRFCPFRSWAVFLSSAKLTTRSLFLLVSWLHQNRAKPTSILVELSLGDQKYGALAVAKALLKPTPPRARVWSCASRAKHAEHSVVPHTTPYGWYVWTSESISASRHPVSGGTVWQLLL